VLYYADDILSLSASCHGLQEMINICKAYRGDIGIIFNPSKSQIVTCGGQNPSQHCYNGDVSFLWENGNSDPCKIETLEHIDTQFVAIDKLDYRKI